VTLPDIAIAVLIGFGAGVLSGVFGVGGGIAMTPGVQVFLGAPPIIALATPLPVILPTAATGAWRYQRAGEVNIRAAAWMGGSGAAAAGLGALATKVIQPHLLLLATAALLGWQAVSILRGAASRAGAAEPATPATSTTRSVIVGVAAGLISGLLGIGGGLVMVPLMAGWLRMPLKQALGTSLLAITAIVIPGTIVHAALGHIDWALAGALTLGAVPGARVGAGLAIGARERTLGVAVGSFLLLAAVAYGLSELWHLLKA
jgi:hypothetical protein